MKIRLASHPSHPSHRRRNPLVLPAVIIAALVVAVLVWAWIAGGEQPVTQVEKVIPAERLGR